MKSLQSLKFVTIPLALTLAACAGDDGDTGASGTTNTSDSGGECVPNMEVSGEISADTTWSCDVVVSGIVNVTNGATLTVEPGVTVYGKSGSALVFAQGTKIMAEGTAESPIVFTSSQAAGMRNRGDWGGVVFLGNAATNLMGGTGIAEGLESNPTYGGGTSPDAAHSCGTLKYVRVEFAGFELTTDNELNGLTFYSCGTGTVVDHVQVHMGDDDGIEIFGGGFDLSHLVLTGISDDSLDLDQGFHGMIQHVFIQQDPADGNYAFEISNQDINLDADPRTKPMIANVTAIGGAGPKSNGIKLKEGGTGEFHNVIVMGFNNAQVDLTETQTEDQANAGEIMFMNSLFFDNNKSGSGLYVVSPMSTFDLKAFVEKPTNGNLFDMDPQLTSTSWGTPNIVPAAASPALNGIAPPAIFTGAPSDFIGAVKDDASDFTKGWTSFTPN